MFVVDVLPLKYGQVLFDTGFEVWDCHSSRYCRAVPRTGHSPIFVSVVVVVSGHHHHHQYVVVVVAVG